MAVSPKQLAVSATKSSDGTNLLGLTNTEFTVTSATAASGESASDLPSVGSVYDVFNLGNGVENVYTAIVGASGSGDTITDTGVTPLGNVNLDWLFANVDAAAPLQPGGAFTGLESGDSSIGADAFSIGGASLGNPASALQDLATQSFNVYTGSGSMALPIPSPTRW